MNGMPGWTGSKPNTEICIATRWALEQEDAEIALGLCGSLLPFWQFPISLESRAGFGPAGAAPARTSSPPTRRKVARFPGTLAYVKVGSPRPHLFADAFLALRRPTNRGHRFASVGPRTPRVGRGDPDAAERQRASFERREAAAENNNDQARLAHSLHYLGLVSSKDSDNQQAATYFRDP